MKTNYFFNKKAFAFVLSIANYRPNYKSLESNSLNNAIIIIMSQNETIVSFWES